MCRWAAHTGREIRLDEVVSRPSHSLVHQSLHAKACLTKINGDGFGLGWYGDRDAPGTYRDTTPAWADDNLRSLCGQLRAKTFFAHVRAATSGAAARSNCHPFNVGPWLFMHNGQIGGFEKVRRVVEGMIPDRFQGERRGATDSEAIFLATLGRVEQDGPIVAFSETLAQILEAMREAGIADPLRFAAAFCDGDLLTVFRWSSDDAAPSVSFRIDDTGLTVASEPLDERGDEWLAMPANHVLTARCADDTSRPALMRFVVGIERDTRNVAQCARRESINRPQSAETRPTLPAH